MSGNLNENPDANPKNGEDCIDQAQVAADEIYCYGGRISEEFLRNILAACSKCEHDGNCVDQREIRMTLDFKPVAGGWPEFSE